MPPMVQRMICSLMDAFPTSQWNFTTTMIEQLHPTLRSRIATTGIFVLP
jgi:hypothetical protein